MPRPRARTEAAGTLDAGRLALDYLVLTGGELAAKLLTFGAFIYLARVLGPERYGRLEFVLAVMFFFTLPVDLGVGAYGARELAKDRTRARTLLSEVAALRLLLAAASFAVLAAAAIALPVDQDTRRLLLLYGLSLFAAPALLQWFFQGQDLMRWVALASLLRWGVFAGLVLLLVRPGSSLLVIGACEIAAVAAAAGLCVLLARRRLPDERLPRPSRAALARHLRGALPIGLSDLAWALLWFSPTVLLGLLAGGRTLGWFGASHRAVLALHTFVELYFFNLLPSLVAGAALPRERLLGLLRGSLAVAAWSSVFVALLVTVLAPTFLEFAYGSEFAGAAPILALLVWTIPLAMLGGHPRYTLIAHDLQGLEFLCTTLAAVVAVPTAIALVPRWGGLGAAAALLVGGAVHLAAAHVVVARRVLHLPLREELARPTVALLVAGAVFGTVAAVHPGSWAAAAASAFAYVVLLLIWQRQGVLELSALVLSRIAGNRAEARRGAGADTRVP